MFNEIPFYLYVSSVFPLLGILWHLHEQKSQLARSALLISGILAVVGISLHAAQPYTLNVEEIIQGKQRALVPSSPELDKISLYIDHEENDTYSELIKTIRRETPDGSGIFVFPNNAEIYFLSERRNPFSFWNTAISFQNEKETSSALHEVLMARPALVIFNQHGSYSSASGDFIRKGLEAEYSRVALIGGFEVLKPRLINPSMTAAVLSPPLFFSETSSKTQ